ncbi:MAG: AcrR family transcriptional regulator [Paraglaciecola sp.]
MGEKMNSAKRKILSAASELFLEGGISALSVRAISKRAGLSTIGIYSHFQGKQGILDELYIQGFELVSAAMDVDKGIASPKEAILQGVKGYLNIAESYEAHYRLIFGESSIAYTPSDNAREASEKAFGRLKKAVSVLLPADATNEDKQKTAIEIWAFVHGFVSLKHHAISDSIKSDEWNHLTLQALTTHIDAIIATRN